MSADGPVVREGVLPGGLPYLSVGSGPPVVVLAGLDAAGGTTNPTGPARAWELRPYRLLAEHRTVLLVRRAPGIPVGCTIADLASQHAEALSRELGEPVDVVGVSTGASVALQLALDHPAVVRRLVLLAGAYRLSDRGRAVQREQARLTVAGRHRRATAATVPAVFSSAAARLAMRAVVLLTTRAPDRRQADDLVRTIEAEDAFDLGGSLGRITAPTLVVGGTADGYYGTALFERTAAGIPRGRLRLLHGSSHASTVTSRRAAREVVRFLEPPDGRPSGPAPRWFGARAGGRHAGQEEADMERRSWADMGPGRRASMVVMAVVQMVLAVTAWADLARRADDEVRGRKAVWAAVIAISYVGPIAYFARGRVRH